MYYRYLYLIKKKWAWPLSSGAWVIIPTLNTENLLKVSNDTQSNR